MTESSLYLDFLKRNLLIIAGPLLISFLIFGFLYTQKPISYNATQSYQVNYTLNDLTQAIALTDEAVAELRKQSFEKAFEDGSVSIYKSAPLMISIEAYSPEKQTSFDLLLKESTYLNDNFVVKPLASPQILLVEPNIYKYFLSALLVGFLVGLSIALIREYLKNY